MRQKVVLATRWPGRRAACRGFRGDQSGLTRAEILNACDGSLRRLQTDVIDLYQIHWPARNLPMFGQMYFDPARPPCASIHEQLDALATLAGGQGEGGGPVQRVAVWRA